MPAQRARDSVQVFWGEMAACEHIVQIYEREAAFLDSLEGFVAEGLANGEGVIVIASPEHRAALESRLAGLRVDLDEARRTGRFQSLHAEAVLASFMRAGWPEDHLFTAAVTDLLSNAGKGGRPVRAFGEMVAVLWARGDRAATLHLEHLWHRLIETQRFSLFCAYPKAGFVQDAAESIEDLRAAHTRVIPDFVA